MEHYEIKQLKDAIIDVMVKKPQEPRDQIYHKFKFHASPKMRGTKVPSFDSCDPISICDSIAKGHFPDYEYRVSYDGYVFSGKANAIFQMGICKT